MKSSCALLTALVLGLSVPAQSQHQETVDSFEPFVSHPPEAVAGVRFVPMGTSCGEELFDSGPFVTSTGDGPGGFDVSLLQNTSLGLTTLGRASQLSGAGPHFRIADQFTIAEDSVVRCLMIYAYQPGSTNISSMTGANIRIWDGAPNVGGSTVVFGDTTTNRLLGTGWTGVYRIAENDLDNTERPVMWLLVDLDDTVLTPGTYWIDWQAAGLIASVPSAPPITIIGETTTGNALQLVSTGWQDYLDGTTATPQGVPFQVFGLPATSILEIPTASGLGLLLLTLLVAATSVWLLSRRV